MYKGESLGVMDIAGKMKENEHIWNWFGRVKRRNNEEKVFE